MTADWPNLDARLAELWMEGHSTAEIGRRLGVSKNAVVSRTHRIDPPLSASSTCRWLHGERPTWTYCGAPSRLGSSWCPDHHAIVFVRPEASRGR